LALLLAVVGCTSSAPDSTPARPQPDAQADSVEPSTDAAADAPIADAGAEAGAAIVTLSRYDYRFDLPTGNASTKLNLDVEAPGTRCIELASLLPLTDMTVSHAPAVRAEQLNGTITLCGEFPDTTVTFESRVTVPETSDPDTHVGFSRRLDAHGNPFTYLLGWVEQCDRFGPCDPSPQRLTNFGFEITHAATDVVLCPGSLQTTAGKTSCNLDGAPTYSSFAIAANPAWQRKPLVTAAGVSVVTYEAPGGRVHAALDPAAVGAFVEWITRHLGPFPYGSELRIATAPVRWLGMEHPANIVVREDLPDVPQLYANVPLHTVLHEIAHHWAGNRTTLAHTLDFAWKEAIAEYLSYVFEEERRPTAEAISARKLWHDIGGGASYPVRPLDDPEVPLSVWANTGYGSGPMTLFIQLEPWLGRATLLQAIRSFLAEPGARSVDDLRLALEAASDRSLRRYFDAWVLGRGSPEWPAFHVETTLSGDETLVTVTQSAPVVFPAVVEVELRGATQSARVKLDFGLEPTSSSTTARAAFDQPVTGIDIDPDNRLLDWSIASARSAAPPALRWHP
jgi:aminopeptidase N